MLKFAFAALAGVLLLAQPASAAMDCGANLDKHTSMIMKMTSATPEKRAALQRMSLRGYDHCMAGDEFNADAFWKMVSTAGNK